MPSPVLNGSKFDEPKVYDKSSQSIYMASRVRFIVGLTNVNPCLVPCVVFTFLSP